MINGQPTSIYVEATGNDLLTLKIEGRLDSSSTGKIWREAVVLLEGKSPAQLVVDASAVDYCDGSGIGLLIELHRRQQMAGGNIEVRGLKDVFRQLLSLFDPAEFEGLKSASVERHSIPEAVGRATFRFFEEAGTLIAFVGELFVALARAFKAPRAVRWKDTLRAAETAGVDAFPIIALVSFLIGLIMAFQSAIPMRQFGAEIYVANLVALSMLRELGPLMTAIVLIGRSGSAFAAELGTMKVNEEIDALATMGLDPVRFLVVPRLIAALIMTPLLTVFADLMGLVGGGIVVLSLGYPLVSYFKQVLSAVTYGDLLGGLLKSFVFGIIVAGIGCFRGLQTKTGASAVGDATTGAVVMGIILIVVVVGIFSVIYFYLGI